MKKLYFILLILVLTMFVGCQMPTDDTGNGAEAEATEYDITIVAPHGTVELDKTKAKAGETVKVLSITADDGYRFKSVIAYKDDNTLLEVNYDHQSFVMPNCNVRIVAEYEAISNDDDTPTFTPTDMTPTDIIPTDITPTVPADGSIYFTETKYGDYELRKTGTLDDDHYMLGVIDNGELKILESTLRFFDYNPNAGLQSK